MLDVTRVFLPVLHDDTAIVSLRYKPSMPSDGNFHEDLVKTANFLEETGICCMKLGYIAHSLKKRKLTPLLKVKQKHSVIKLVLTSVEPPTFQYECMLRCCYKGAIARFSSPST